MLADYDIERCTKRCAATGKTLAPGSRVYSVLLRDGARLVRQDYCAEAWTGPPDGAVAWWQYRVPDEQAARRHWAPSEVMLEFLERLADQPDQQDLRYVLALLMVRRRILQEVEVRQDQQGREVLLLHAPEQERDYQVIAVPPANDQRAQWIQQELERLLQ
ncbi:MAG: hypothetical protein KatS3mg110_3184 [Pirellulaceae bacterium]|nr:MAG: hypothetical protein KatS3mg110_3184 [Pirellulaceae bacterium]